MLVVAERSDELTLEEPAQRRRPCTCSRPDQLNTYDVLVSDDVVFTRSALDEFLGRPGQGPHGRSASEPLSEPRWSAVMSPIHKDHRDVLLAPVVSEKSYGLLDENKYTFLVHPDANKTADQDRGREGLRRQGARASTRSTARASASAPAPASARRKATKRAIVTVAEGDRIDIFGGPV